MTTFQKINLGLVILVVVIAAWLLLTPGRVTEPGPVRVTTLNTDTVTRISVVRRDSETLEFTRNGQDWRMQSPQQGQANPARINAMLYLAQAPSFAQLPGSQHDLQQFGLRNPVVTLSLDDEEFLFGSDNPLDKRRYVLHDGVVHLVNDNLYYQLLQPVEFFLSGD